MSGPQTVAHLGFQKMGDKFSLDTSAHTNGAKLCFSNVSYGEFFLPKGAMAHCLPSPKYATGLIFGNI